MDGDQDLSVLRSTAHPVRLRMLSLLTASAMSAAEVARELDLTHANASYHLRLLAENGLLVVQDEERIRGGRAKRYRHVWNAPTTSTSDSAAVHVGAMASELVRRFEMRSPDHRTLTTDAELWVDPAVWERVRGLVLEASALLHDQAQSPRSNGAVPVNLTAVAFRMQP